MADTRLTAALPPLNTLQNSISQQRENLTDAKEAFEASARNQANEFEATFLASVLQPIFEGLAKDRTFGGGFGEEAFTGLLTQEYARGIAGNAGIGIADQVYEQLIKLQETPDITNTSDSSENNTTVE